MDFLGSFVILNNFSKTFFENSSEIFEFFRFSKGIKSEISQFHAFIESYLRNGSVHRSSVTHSAFVFGLCAHWTKFILPAEIYTIKNFITWPNFENRLRPSISNSLLIPISSNTCLNALFCSTNCLPCIAKFRAEVTCLSLLQIILSFTSDPLHVNYCF